MNAGFSTWLKWGVLGLLAGVLLIAILPIVVGMAKKGVVLLVGGLGLSVILYYSGAPRAVLLFVWVVSITYNRQYWPFPDAFGDYSSFGPYWMVSDVLLLVLLGMWAFEAIILKRPQNAYGSRFWPWYAPYVIVAGLSLIGANEPAWGLSDMLRILKLAVILWYFRYNVGPTEWKVIIAALGVTLCIQSLLGLLEFTTGRTGVLWLVGLGAPDPRAALGIDALFGGWNRATGTLAHPPYLATFLLMTLPIFVALALCLRAGPFQWICTAVAALGAIGLMCTLSRSPLAIIVGQMGLLLWLLVITRTLPVTRAIGVGCIGLLCVTLLGAGLADRIYDRLTRDFDSSVDYRVDDYKVSAAMIRDYPVLGVGLNNYPALMEKYGSKTSWGIEPKWQVAAVEFVKMRILAGPLNGWLYVATVTGLLGLATFLFWTVGGLVIGARAIKANDGAIRVICVGMVVGIVGMCIQQTLDYSIWIDSIIGIWTVMVGLLGGATVLFNPERDGVDQIESDPDAPRASFPRDRLRV